MAVTKPLPGDVKRAFLFPYDSWANRIATHRFVQDIPRGIGAPNDIALAKIEAALPELARHPVAIIWGGDDFCFNDHYFARWKSLLPAASSHYLEHTGHYLLEDAREKVTGLIAQHLAAR
jgi:haloalkane dehalogenase